MRVSVEYHRLEGGRFHAARVTATTNEGAPRTDAPPPSDVPRGTSAGTRAQVLDDPTLPHTASPLLIVGALGLASLIASKALQIANQGH
jgi:hypothetical protein